MRRAAVVALVVALVAALAWGLRLRAVAHEQEGARASLCRALGSQLVGVSRSDRASTHLELVTTMSDVLSFCGVDARKLGGAIDGATLAGDAARSSTLLRAAGQELQLQRSER